MINKKIMKSLVSIIIILLIGVNTVSGINIQLINPINPHSSNLGNTLYVGGSGPGNYTKIQDAIDDAVDGDTVFVYDDSSPYYENIIIDKSINLIGEDKNTTIIFGQNIEGEDTTVLIYADGVYLSSFTIKTEIEDYGIWIRQGNNSIVTNNIIDDCDVGICIYPIYKESSKNMIYNNIIKNCYIGIAIWFSSDNSISHNIIHDCILPDNFYGGGIDITQGHNTMISNNDIRLNGGGIYVGDSDNVSISLNNIKQNTMGISSYSANSLQIINNNIYLNRARNIVFTEFKGQNMYVNNNYWGVPIFNLKMIYGTLKIYLFTIHLDKWFPPWGDIPIYLSLPKKYVDWNPAKEPFDIGV